MSMQVFIKTYGCQMNVYDSDKMLEVLRAHFGATQTEDIQQADIILLNTCSIREKAQEKVFSELGRFRPLKKQNPDLIIGVGGCVASQEGESIIKRAPYVDLVFGPQTLHRLPQLIRQKREGKKAAIDISFPEIEKFDHLPPARVEGATAYVSIMEGCNKYCSFCVVPYTRGTEISRPFDDVIAEIAHLEEAGVKEITLLGQNVNDYRGIMDDGSIADLACLIHYVAAFEGIQRIRFTTSHPQAFDDNLIQAYAEEPKLANHLHLPVQSGSDRVLTAMKRHYTALAFKAQIRKLREVRPNISISSDFIVGFPGESDADFEATMRLVESIGFDHSYSFIYSKRPGTPAAFLKDDIPLETKKTRLKRLQDTINANTYAISRRMVGNIESVLFTAPSKHHPTQLTGRTENNRFVHAVAPKELINQMVKVKITHATPHALMGEVVPEAVEANP